MKIHLSVLDILVREESAANTKLAGLNCQIIGWLIEAKDSKTGGKNNKIGNQLV